jgi:adenine/guanine phosphoribosyltransferase-like PRPP-binding protein
MRASPTLPPPGRILVVDDFVTKGATLLAAVSLVQAVFPESEVRGFALVRTMGRVPDVERIVHPCEGTIRLLPGGDVLREP